jgi:hypothetical protein
MPSAPAVYTVREFFEFRFLKKACVEDASESGRGPRLPQAVPTAEVVADAGAASETAHAPSQARRWPLFSSLGVRARLAIPIHAQYAFA